MSTCSMTLSSHFPKLLELPKTHNQRTSAPLPDRQSIQRNQFLNSKKQTSCTPPAQANLVQFPLL